MAKVVLNYFLDILALVLSRLWSDHCLIILKSGVLDYEPISFFLKDPKLSKLMNLLLLSSLTQGFKWKDLVSGGFGLDGV